MTGRGQMRDDPLEFAILDTRSRAALIWIVLSTMAAYYTVPPFA
jgi:hypothetical protein